jgi:4a-hydroxytetrahydrobiopterin dehydratase
MIVESEIKKSVMKALSENEVVEYLSLHAKSWVFDKNTIQRDFKFKTFVEAFSFMTAIALEAEKLDHHPDWSNSYNLVSIVLTNHAAKGVTQLDFDMAKKIDRIFGS